MSGGALGRGSFRSVVAGTQARPLPTYHHSAYELVQLHKAHLDVLRCFYVRDKIFDNHFPGTALANGVFKLPPARRADYHAREVTEAIRRRTLWLQRIQQQRAINAYIVRRATAAAAKRAAAAAAAATAASSDKKAAAKAVTTTTSDDDDMQRRFSYRTADADVYFAPRQYTAANTWPNYWQHPSMAHVVPNPRWRRVPELDNITRVLDPVLTPPGDY